jgi:hypothetical protein
MITELMRLYQELVEKSDGSHPQTGTAEMAGFTVRSIVVQTPGGIHPQPGTADIAESKRKLNRRCSRLERARHSFRLTRSHLVFASGECPTGATLGSLLQDLFDS